MMGTLHTFIGGGVHTPSPPAITYPPGPSQQPGIIGMGRKKIPKHHPRSGHSPTYGVNGNTKIAGSTHFLTTADLTPELVHSYLKENPAVLEDYVMNDVELELLERWMIRRTQRLKSKRDGTEQPNGKIARKTSLSRWKFCVHADKRKMLQELTQSLQMKPNKGHVLWELGSCISSAVNAEAYNLYIVNRDTQEIHYFDKDMHSLENGETIFAQKIGAGACVAAYVAKTKQTLRVASTEGDPRFPDGVAMNRDDAKIILCQPIIQSDGELLGILELYRREGGSLFHEEDEEIVQSYLVWGGIALHYAELYCRMVKQRQLSDFLLNVVRSIFQDMVSMDTVIMKVMNFAQKLVNADRASLFLVDSETKELYARIFDVGNQRTDRNGGTSSKEIRFPIGTGIAGQVAHSGEILNIPDAYKDPRFNRSVDLQTGYTTRSILCMPIFIGGDVIGVVQMVNKQNGVFNQSDEEAFEVFASYCGLALHHTKLYDQIRRSEQMYKVAMEMLSYYNCCSEEDVEGLKSQPLFDDVSPDIDKFYFATNKLDKDEKARQSIFMFQDLFGLSRFDLDSLTRFTLTVRKNYRRVPYHNWTHGFTVAHAVYAILKNASNVFQLIESVALYIGCMCHDLDHRGKTNKFMLETASPLASMYTTSTLEHHHFNQTVSILQVLSNIRHCILATDLALFFPNKAKMETILQKNSFDWNNHEHRLLLEAIVMTSCDLCASCKPWEQQLDTVKVIFEEFYEQGDLERASGRTPIPMMDRNKADQQAISQVGFLKGICIPCYEILSSLIPETKPLLEGCQKNLAQWQKLADEETNNKDGEDSK